MNKEDRDETREIFKDVLQAHTNEMIGRLNVLGSQLTTVDMKVTKTNGRVNDLEHDIDLLKMHNVEHLIQCPMIEKVNKLDTSIVEKIKPLEDRIKPLETEEITRQAKAKFLLLMWLILGSTSGALVFGVLKYIFSGK